MEKNNPAIWDFNFIYQQFLQSTNELELNASWQTVIYTVPVGHLELTSLHAAAKERQKELRDTAAKEKAEAEKLEKEKTQLITKDFTRDDNVRRFSKK